MKTNVFTKENIKIATYAASRVYRKFTTHQEFDLEDVQQMAMLGLIDAHRRFDESKGYKFKTYAPIRIMGHILDEIRIGYFNRKKNINIMVIPLNNETQFFEDENLPTVDSMNQEQIEDFILDIIFGIRASSLLPRERLAVYFHFIDELTMEETGDLMKVTGSRAQQMCKEGIKKLKRILKKAEIENPFE